MGRKRSPGLRNRAGIWHIEKQILGRTIHESTGTSDLEAAELILARRIEEVRQAKVFGVRPQRIFREAATKFLEENVHLHSIGDYAMHLKQLDPFIGDLPLEHVHLGTLQSFIEARRKQGIKTKSINSAHSKFNFNRRNDIHPPRNTKQLYNLNLDLDSPRMKLAMDNLGINQGELQLK